MSALLHAALDRIAVLEASLAFYADVAQWDAGGEAHTDRGEDARRALGLHQDPPVCDRCGAPVVGSRDPAHKMGRLHEGDCTTADRWCRKV